MCINSMLSLPIKEGTPLERVEKLISTVKDEYDLDISVLREDMIHAEIMDKLEFAFLGPGIMGKAKFDYYHNCYLHMPGKSFYFWSEKGYRKEKMPA